MAALEMCTTNTITQSLRVIDLFSNTENRHGKEIFIVKTLGGDLADGPNKII